MSGEIEGRFRDVPPPVHPDEIEAAVAPASERQVWILRFQAEHGRVNEIAAIRRVLKNMLRGWGLRCLSILPEKPQG